MKPEHIEDVLVHLHSGQWFGWSNSKDKVYDNLVIHSADDKPTQEWLEAELARQQEEWDAEQVAAAETKASAIEKLKILGLNDAEIASITGG
jgi:hypothetical protein|tara:strand:- start:2047 stop:2322 length:276 start_codon:yes stop_codon:yes gene_type:complete